MSEDSKIKEIGMNLPVMPKFKLDSALGPIFEYHGSLDSYNLFEIKSYITPLTKVDYFNKKRSFK